MKNFDFPQIILLSKALAKPQSLDFSAAWEKTSSSIFHCNSAL